MEQSRTRVASIATRGRLARNIAAMRSSGGGRTVSPHSEFHTTTETKCPFNHAAGAGTSNRDWWPNQLRLDILHQHSAKSDPMGTDFDYRAEFKSLDFAA